MATPVTGLSIAPPAKDGKKEIPQDKLTEIFAHTHIIRHHREEKDKHGKKIKATYYEVLVTLTSRDGEEVKTSFDVHSKKRGDAARWAVVARFMAKQFDATKLTEITAKGAKFGLKKEGGGMGGMAPSTFKLFYESPAGKKGVFTSDNRFAEGAPIIRKDRAGTWFWTLDLGAPIRHVDGINGWGFTSKNGPFAEVKRNFNWGNIKKGFVNGLKKFPWAKKTNWSEDKRLGTGLRLGLTLLVSGLIATFLGATGGWFVAAALVAFIGITVLIPILYGIAQETKLSKVATGVFQKLLIGANIAKMGGQNGLFGVYNKQFRGFVKGMVGWAPPRIRTWEDYHVQKIIDAHDQVYPEPKKKKKEK